MKISKILFVVVMFGMLCVCQRGFTMTAHLVNLSPERGVEAKGTEAALRTEIAAAEKANKDKLASNTMIDAELIAQLGKVKEAVIQVGGVNVKGITDPAAYVTGYAATGLAGGTVNIDGDTYDLSESTVNPILFSAEFAMTQTDEFKKAIEAVQRQPDQIAVIVTTESNAEAIRTSLEAKGVNFDKVSIVQAMTGNSKDAFVELFNRAGEGFSLRDANRTNPLVVTRALQGAV